MAGRPLKSESASFYAQKIKLPNVQNLDHVKTEEDLDKWLRDNPPTQVHNSGSISGIMLGRNLTAEWEKLKNSGKPIDCASILELAKGVALEKGAWYFQIETGDRINTIWKKIAEEFSGGSLNGIASCVWVTPKDPTKSNYKHTVAVENRRFANETIVFQIEKILRGLGVKEKMVYRPEIYDHIGIDEFHLKPVLYESVYNDSKNDSEIISCINC